jgi:hypothetical protein
VAAVCGAPEHPYSPVQGCEILVLLRRHRLHSLGGAGAEADDAPPPSVSAHAGPRGSRAYISEGAVQRHRHSGVATRHCLCRCTHAAPTPPAAAHLPLQHNRVAALPTAVAASSAVIGEAQNCESYGSMEGWGALGWRLAHLSSCWATGPSRSSPRSTAAAKPCCTPHARVSGARLSSRSTTAGGGDGDDDGDDDGGDAFESCCSSG